MCPRRAEERPGPGDVATLLDVPASGRGVEHGRHQPETEDRQECNIEFDRHWLEHQHAIPLVEPRRAQQGRGLRRTLRKPTERDGVRAASPRLDDGGLVGPHGGLLDQNPADVHPSDNDFW